MIPVKDIWWEQFAIYSLLQNTRLESDISILKQANVAATWQRRNLRHKEMMLPWVKFTPVCTTVVCSVALCHSQQLCPVTGTWPNSVCGLHRMSFMHSETMPKQGEHGRELSPPFFLVVEYKSPSWILSGHWFSHRVSDFRICFKSCLPEPTTWQNTDYSVIASFKSDWCISLHQSHFTPETFCFGVFVPIIYKFHLKLLLPFSVSVMTMQESVPQCPHSPTHRNKQIEGGANWYVFKAL